MKPKELKAWLVFTKCSTFVLEKGIVLKLPEAEKGIRDRAWKTDERGDGWGDLDSHPNSTKDFQPWTMYCYISHLWSGDTETCLRFLRFKHFTWWNVLYPLLYHQDSVAPWPDSVRCFQSAFVGQIKFPSLTTFLLYPIWQWHTNHQWLTPQSATFGAQAVCVSGVDT